MLKKVIAYTLLISCFTILASQDQIQMFKQIKKEKINNEITQYSLTDANLKAFLFITKTKNKAAEIKKSSFTRAFHGTNEHFTMDDFQILKDHEDAKKMERVLDAFFEKELSNGTFDL